MASKVPINLIKSIGIFTIIIGITSFFLNKLNESLTSFYGLLIGFDTGKGTGTLITLIIGVLILIVGAILEKLKK